MRIGAADARSPGTARTRRAIRARSLHRAFRGLRRDTAAVIGSRGLRRTCSAIGCLGEEHLDAGTLHDCLGGDLELGYGHVGEARPDVCDQLALPGEVEVRQPVPPPPSMLSGTANRTSVFWSAKRIGSMPPSVWAIGTGRPSFEFRVRIVLGVGFSMQISTGQGSDAVRS